MCVSDRSYGRGHLLRILQVLSPLTGESPAPWRRNRLRLGEVGRGQCPLCRRKWYDSGVNDRLADLSTVVSGVRRIDNMELEFVIPQSRMDSE